MYRPLAGVTLWAQGVVPGDLAEDSRAALAQVTARCAELQATRALVRDFADMLCRRRASTWKPGPGGRR